jgi:hypothetical protein
VEGVDGGAGMDDGLRWMRWKYTQRCSGRRSFKRKDILVVVGNVLFPSIQVVEVESIGMKRFKLRRGVKTCCGRPVCLRLRSFGSRALDVCWLLRLNG